MVRIMGIIKNAINKITAGPVIKYPLNCCVEKLFLVIAISYIEGTGTENSVPDGFYVAFSYHSII